MLWSYFPNITAEQMKQILMDSGDTYPVVVKAKNADGTMDMVPFTSLSKSGKVLNAYKASIMAKELSGGK